MRAVSFDLIIKKAELNMGNCAKRLTKHVTLQCVHMSVTAFHINMRISHSIANMPTSVGQLSKAIRKNTFILHFLVLYIFHYKLA